MGRNSGAAAAQACSCRAACWQICRQSCWQDIDRGHDLEAWTWLQSRLPCVRSERLFLVGLEICAPLTARGASLAAKPQPKFTNPWPKARPLVTQSRMLRCHLVGASQTAVLLTAHGASILPVQCNAAVAAEAMHRAAWLAVEVPLQSWIRPITPLTNRMPDEASAAVFGLEVGYLGKDKIGKSVGLSVVRWLAVVDFFALAA